MKRKNSANICFNCKNAVPDDRGHGCSWSRRFEPVPGWTAEPYRLYSSGPPIETWDITACPMFDPDGSSESYRSDRTVSVRCVETGVVYPSLRAAAASVGVKSGSAIRESIKRGYGFVYGYHWELVKK